MVKISHRLQKQTSEAMDYTEAVKKLKLGYAVTFKTWGDQDFYVIMSTEERPIKNFPAGTIVRRWKFGHFYPFPMEQYEKFHNWLIYNLLPYKRHF